MGPIQSSINQTLSIAGMLVGMNPKVRQYQEQQAKLQEARADVEAANRMAQYGSTEGDKGNIRVQREIARRAEEATARLFSVDPTEESYESYRQAAQFRDQINNNPRSFFDTRRISGTREPVISTSQSRAQEHLREQQERRRAGRQPSIEERHEMERQAATEYRQRLLEDKDDGEQRSNV